MKKWLFAAAAAGLTLAGGAAMAQPYGYYDGSYYGGRGYDYGYQNRGYVDRGYYRGAYRDSDRDGIPDRAEWNRDRDHDGRPDQWDRYDNRRRHHHHRDGYRRYERPAYGYSYGYGW